MAMVELRFAGRPGAVICDALEGCERLGEPVSMDVSIISPEPIDVAAVLRKPCAIRILVGSDARTIAGIVTRVAAVATALAENARRYRITVRSALALLEHRRRSRVFQHLSVPEILQKVLIEGGYPPSAIHLALQAPHPQRAYVVQYAETDAALVRRLCEEEGLYVGFGVDDDGEVVVIGDTSEAAPPALDAPLPVVDESMLSSRARVAFSCSAVRRRRPGTVTARSYDPEHPATTLEGIARSGTSFERGTEVYISPATTALRDPMVKGASLVLESLRAEAAIVSFRTTAIAVSAGLSLELTCNDDLLGTARPHGQYLAVSVQHRWRAADPRYELDVRAIPRAVPFRLPRTTPRPRIAGLHPAVVTGAPGEEIHVDERGRVTVRFLWDREAPGDQRALGHALVAAEPAAARAVGTDMLSRVGAGTVELLKRHLGAHEPAVVASAARSAARSGLAKVLAHELITGAHSTSHTAAWESARALTLAGERQPYLEVQGGGTLASVLGARGIEILVMAGDGTDIDACEAMLSRMPMTPALLSSVARLGNVTVWSFLLHHLADPNLAEAAVDALRTLFGDMVLEPDATSFSSWKHAIADAELDATTRYRRGKPWRPSTVVEECLSGALPRVEIECRMDELCARVGAALHADLGLWDAEVRAALAPFADHTRARDAHRRQGAWR